MRRLAGPALVIIALHVVGVVLLLRAGGALGAGAGLTAYTLGLRHAFDADHIGAIDNTTPKLMADGQRPVGVGFFFSLGHSTIVFALAALLATAGTAAAGGLPLYAILCLPILFAAGMCLLDTIDGGFMTVAYGWAFSRPVRKVFYNLTVTGLSVAVALLIGGIELTQVLTGWPDVDLDYVGYVIVGLLVVTWAAALSVWHFGEIEEKWEARLRAD